MVMVGDEGGDAGAEGHGQGDGVRGLVDDADDRRGEALEAEGGDRLGRAARRDPEAQAPAPGALAVGVAARTFQVRGTFVGRSRSNSNDNAATPDRVRCTPPPETERSYPAAPLSACQRKVGEADSIAPAGDTGLGAEMTNRAPLLQAPVPSAFASTHLERERDARRQRLPDMARGAVLAAEEALQNAASVDAQIVAPGALHPAPPEGGPERSGDALRAPSPSVCRGPPSTPGVAGPVRLGAGAGEAGAAPATAAASRHRRTQSARRSAVGGTASARPRPPRLVQGEVARARASRPVMTSLRSRGPRAATRCLTATHSAVPSLRPIVGNRWSGT